MTVELATRRRARMDPWRLEWLRLTRTPRGLVVLLVYLFFGLVGPLMAKYVARIAKMASSGITILVPPAKPADGIVNYVNQVSQTGLLVVVVVAAGALSFDARRGLATFYRTHAPTAFALIWPRYVANTALAVLAYLLGTLAAWYETALVLGAVPANRVLLGVVCEAVFLAFAVAVVAAAATLGGSTLATVGIAIGALLVLPILGTVAAVRPWLPSSLASAPAALLTDPGIGDLARAATVTVLATAALVRLASHRSARREL
jgi:ABC-2 type transport system permease protein